MVGDLFLFFFLSTHKSGPFTARAKNALSYMSTDACMHVYLAVLGALTYMQLSPIITYYYYYTITYHDTEMSSEQHGTQKVIIFYENIGITC